MESKKASRPAVASGTTRAKPPRQSNSPGEVREKYQIASSKHAEKVLDDRRGGNAQIKKDDTAVKKANTVSWLAASHAHKGGESRGHRQARLRAMFDRVDDVGLKQKEMSIDDRVGQSKGRAQLVADENRAGFEGMGAWSVRGKH